MFEVKKALPVWGATMKNKWNHYGVAAMFTLAVGASLVLAGCGGAKTDSTASTTTTEKTEAAATEAADSAASADATVENKDKPLCWFNRQPSLSLIHI